MKYDFLFILLGKIDSWWWYVLRLFGYPRLGFASHQGIPWLEIDSDHPSECFQLRAL